MNNDTPRSKFFELRAAGIFLTTLRLPRKQRHMEKVWLNFVRAIVYPMMGGDFDDVYEKMLVTWREDPETALWLDREHGKASAPTMSPPVGMLGEPTDEGFPRGAA